MDETLPYRADFDARAATWDDDPRKAERAAAVARAIAPHLPARDGLRALEYGCGTGVLSFLLRDRFTHLTLADVSEGMLAVAREKIHAAGDDGMQAVRLDLLADADPAERFDVVMSLMTLHHIPDTAAILRRFHDVLRPGGMLFIADLDPEDGSFHGEGFDGHLGFDRDALGRLARAAAFRDVGFSTADVMTKKAAGKDRSFPIFLMVAHA